MEKRLCDLRYGDRTAYGSTVCIGYSGWVNEKTGKPDVVDFHLTTWNGLYPIDSKSVRMDYFPDPKALITVLN